jgi:hypothetical protein
MVYAIEKVPAVEEKSRSHEVIVIKLKISPNRVLAILNFI